MGSTPSDAFDRGEFYQSEHPSEAELEAELDSPAERIALGADIRLTYERVFIAENGAVHEHPAREIGAAVDSPIGLLFGDPGVWCITVTRSTGETVTYRRPTTEDDL